MVKREGHKSDYDPHDGDIHLRGLVPLRAADVVSGGGDVLCLCTASDQ